MANVPAEIRTEHFPNKSHDSLNEHPYTDDTLNNTTSLEDLLGEGER
jgi:hypothetical protein